MRVSAALESV